MLLMSVVPTQAGIISGDLSDLFKDKRYYKRILWHRPDLFSPNYGVAFPIAYMILKIT